MRLLLEIRPQSNRNQIKMHMEQVYKLWNIKIASHSEIDKTIYHNDSYLLSFGKINLYKIEISHE